MEERNMPSTDPHHSTADLLSWSEIRRPDHSPAAYHSTQPSDGISEALSGCHITNEESESFNKKKNCSGHKLKEMTGSDIFSDNGKDDPNHQTRIHYHQDQLSQISFSGEENVTPKKPTTLTEAAKQKELSRTVETEADSKSKKKQISNANTKAISCGHDIFASLSGEENVSPKKSTTLTEAAKQKELSKTVETESDSKSKKKHVSNSKTKAISGSHDIIASPLHPESQPRRFLAATQQEVKGNSSMEESSPRNSRASNGKSGNRLFSEEHVVKSSRKIHNQKFQELTSNGVFVSDKIPPGHSEKMQSSAKKREMSGHNIFADGKSEYRDYYGGERRPPGGESSISLV
ncbi:DNA oxidative demethylase ALKBH2 [Cardamine amara subsp. amara]|uniref:DNA oxidative demethylase ALKBH2 n=1 Tax=Cardamine amara subsp. amara TaxID=228776 RepID=A0ABD0ZBB3_CARAN